MSEVDVNYVYRQVGELTKKTTELLETILGFRSTLEQQVQSASESAQSAAESEQGASDSLQSVELLKTELEALSSQAQVLVDNAVAVVYGEGASATSAPGGIPVADAEGKIDPGWLPANWPELQGVLALAISNVSDLLPIWQRLEGHDHWILEANEKLKKLQSQLSGFEKTTSKELERLAQNQELLTYASWSQFEYVTELNRLTWQSGVIRARKYEYTGYEAYHQPTSTGYTPYNGHNHGNIKNLVGTGEFSVMANGVVCRLRHNDDGLYKPCQFGENFDNRQAIDPAEMPSDIAALTDPAEQIELAKKYIQVMAGELPKSAVADFDNAAQWVMTGIEVYPEIYKHGESLKDPFPGHRHQINVETLPELFKQEQFYNLGGHKNIRENSVGIAMAINDMDEEGNPIVVLWRYRFISAPVGSVADYPIDDLLQFYDDNANEQRWSNYSSHEQYMNTRLPRFRVRQRLGEEAYSGAFNRPTLLDELIAKIPGLDGYGNTLTEEYHYYGANDKLKEYGGTEPLKAGYYNRWYTMSGNDASNRRNAMRGFSDDKLWVARNTNPRIKSSTFGSESYAFSYFIPLEMHLQSFLNGNFNVYGIPDVTDQYTTTQLRQMLSAGVGRSASNPMPGFTNYFYYYTTPSELFTEPDDGDPADTIEPGGLWMTCADGVPRKHYASGYGYFLPTYGVTQQPIRTRYPIYFSHFEGSEAFKYIEASRTEQKSALALQISNTTDLLLVQQQVHQMKAKEQEQEGLTAYQIAQLRQQLESHRDSSKQGLDSVLALSISNAINHIENMR